MGSPTMGMWECQHGVDGRDRCDECLGYGYDAGPDPDLDTVDRWDSLRALITTYGSERFNAGVSALRELQAGSVPRKLHASGTPGSETMLKIIRLIGELQREAGDD